MKLTLDALRRDFEPVEVAAVCMCSGNRRGLFQPHVPGVQWGGGAMGCARWRGARLRDILDRAGIAKDAVEVVFDGADGPVVDKTPDFVKSIPAWKANDESVIVAYEMNGEALPHLNGAPARLVVPGWTATYWMKHLTTIEAIAKPFDGFWVKSAYRIPRGLFPLVERFTSQDTVAKHAHHRDAAERDHRRSGRGRDAEGRAGGGVARASPGTAATGFVRSRSRPTAATPGTTPPSAMISAASPSAPGATPSPRRRPGARP